MNGFNPSSGSPPPNLSTSERKKAVMEPIRLDFESKIAYTSCGKSRTNTKSLVKNHKAWTLCTCSAIRSAPEANNTTDQRIRTFICSMDNFGARRRLQQFQLNIDAADKIDALKLDVTAPTIDPNPSSATQTGVALRSIRGSACDGCSWTRAASSGGKRYASAAMPIKRGGATNAIVSSPDRIDMDRACLSDLHESTRWK